MSLFFYSAWLKEPNFSIDRQIISQLKSRGKSPRDIQITFIPSASYDSENDFIEVIDHFKDFGIRKFLMLPVDIDTDDTLYKQAMCSDLIHLGGGNTFYFLKHLKSSGVLAKLKEYYLKGGLISGLSAGAIILTPSIFLADYPHFDRDENYIKLKNFSALKLVNFEFFPHYRNSQRYRQALADYSQSSKKIIMACPDGSGLACHGEHIQIFGKAWVFRPSQKIELVSGIT